MVILGSIFRNIIDVVKFVAYDIRSEYFAEMFANAQMEIAFTPQVKDLLGGFHIVRHTCQVSFFPNNFRFSNS